MDIIPIFPALSVLHIELAVHFKAQLHIDDAWPHVPKPDQFHQTIIVYRMCVSIRYSGGKRQHGGHFHLLISV